MDDGPFHRGAALVVHAGDPLRERRAPHVLPEERLGRREAQGRRGRVHLHAGESGGAHEDPNLVRVVQREHHVDEAPHLRPDVLGEGPSQETEDRRRRSGDVDPDTPARRRDPSHLSQRRDAVREELHAELTRHDVERFIGERQLFGLRLVPLDRQLRRRRGARYLEHAGVEVGPGHRARGADTRGCQLRHDAGAAGDIQRALTGLGCEPRDEGRRQRRGDRRDEVPLVVLRARPSVGAERRHLRIGPRLDRLPEGHAEPPRCRAVLRNL
jgi:hypothetical protein